VQELQPCRLASSGRSAGLAQWAGNLMFELWLRSGAVGIIGIPFVVLFLVVAGIVWLTHLSPARPFFVSCIGITGPFFASVAVLFGLFAAFLASDAQQRDAHARAAVFREADGVRTILRLAEALGGAGEPLKTAAVAYIESVLAAHPRDGAAEDLTPLRNLSAAALAPGTTAAAPPAAHQAILEGLVQIRQARLERITLTTGTSAPINWIAMLILGVLTQVAVAVVHLERVRAQALALCVFTAAFVATVALIGLAEWPFAGHIDEAPLRAALASAHS
jgi:hypothetical protein